MFNFLFTYPKFTLSAHGIGYPATFVIMFITAFIAGSIANKLKSNIAIAARNAKEREEAAALAEKERLRANMLRSISHDLRSPLTSISGNASNLMSNSGTIDEKTKQQIYSDIYNDSMWLINLVENLLYSTRIDNGKMELRLSTELLDEIVGEAVSHITKTSHSHNIRITNSDEILLANADPRLIMQVVINLVDNAIKYSPDVSTVEIRTYKEGESAVVSVLDSGSGISDDDKEKVFEMFYTGKSASSDSRRSLGLGLALCRSIIEAHGGTICISDNESNGTAVTFTLPVGEVDIDE